MFKNRKKESERNWLKWKIQWKVNIGISGDPTEEKQCIETDYFRL